MSFGNDESFAAVVCSIPMVCAGFSMLILPQAMVLWCVVGGFAQGACLVVALTLIALRGQGERNTVVLSSLVQSLGYLLAATGPLIFGVCTQITANHTLALVVFTGTAVLQCVVAYYAGRK